MTGDQEVKTTAPPSPADIKRWQANLDDEIDGVAVYRYLAAAEKDPDRRAIFEEMAEIENRHADIWRSRLRDVGVDPREHGPSLKVRAIGRVAKIFGVRSVLGIVRSLEAGAYGVYMSQDAAAQALAPDEQMHKEMLDRMIRGDTPAVSKSGADGARADAAGDELTRIVRPEGWHRGGAGGTLRAAVFGVSDGLVSNTALVMGFAGASTEGEFILLAGISGLLAGAFSMAAGEYVSMRAQRELFERQIAIEREELRNSPEQELEELRVIYRAKGFSPELAETLAQHIMRDPEVALDTMIREELGLNPDELGSPWGAAISSFLAFALGALVPVIPFIFGEGSWEYVAASCVLSGIALFGVGALLSLFTGRSALYSGARQVALGALAAGATFAIGSLVGVSTGV